MNLLGIVVLIVGLIFVFKGEPDLFDKYHDKAMQQEECAPVTDK